MKKYFVGIAGVAVCASLLATAPSSAASAATAGADPAFEQAKTTFLAAAYLSEGAARVGFELYGRTAYETPSGVSFATRARGWASGNKAAIKYEMLRGKRKPVALFSGSFGGTDPVAWTKLPPGGENQAVLKQLPKGSQYAVGPLPGSVTGYTSAALGFSAPQVLRTMVSLGAAPWSTAEVFRSCNKFIAGMRVDCSGEVSTISGKRQAWTFRITTTFGELTSTSRVKAYSNERGLLVAAQISGVEDGSNVLSTVTATYSSRVAVPSPKSGRHNVSSNLLTSAAASAGAKLSTARFVTELNSSLRASKRSVTAANVDQVFNKAQGQFPIMYPTNSWVMDVKVKKEGSGTFTVTAFADDGITTSTASLRVYISNGKIVASSK